MEFVQGCAVSAASVAAVLDVWSRRIPNWVTFGTFIAGVAVNVWLHGMSGVVVALVGAALGMALLLPFYAIRAIGAGDVKLLGALGALLGPQLLISVALYGAVAGGVMSAVILLVRGRLWLVLHDLLVARRPPTLSGATAPYGIAIASGVYLSLFLPGVLS
jgi:prepilin peptidase CpaA